MFCFQSFQGSSKHLRKPIGIHIWSLEMIFGEKKFWSKKNFRQVETSFLQLNSLVKCSILLTKWSSISIEVHPFAWRLRNLIHNILKCIWTSACIQGSLQKLNRVSEVIPYHLESWRASVKLGIVSAKSKNKTNDT